MPKITHDKNFVKALCHSTMLFVIKHKFQHKSGIVQNMSCKKYTIGDI
jgi:hypothetical protein